MLKKKKQTSRSDSAYWKVDDNLLTKERTAVNMYFKSFSDEYGSWLI